RGGRRPRGVLAGLAAGFGDRGCPDRRDPDLSGAQRGDREGDAGVGGALRLAPPDPGGLIHGVPANGRAAVSRRVMTTPSDTTAASVTAQAGASGLAVVSINQVITYGVVPPNSATQTL